MAELKRVQFQHPRQSALGKGAHICCNHDSHEFKAESLVDHDLAGRAMHELGTLRVTSRG